MRLTAALLALTMALASPALARSRYGDENYYRSSDGMMVHRPTRGSVPGYGRVMATCRDGATSYSHHHRGTCSGHGGVSTWAGN